MKIINIFFILIFSFVLLSCSYEGEKYVNNKAQNSFDPKKTGQSQSADVQSIFEINMRKESNIHDSNDLELDTENNPLEENNIAETSEYNGEEIDIDLTAMNPMLVYGEVFNMVENPRSYIGKIVKLEGYYASFTDTYNDKNYFFVAVEDALACCAQGVEFVFNDSSKRSYPIDYPEDGSYVELIGEFDVYEMQGYTFFRIKTDHVRVL